MTFEPAKAREHVAPVVDNTRLSRRYFMLRLARPDDFLEPSAGSFVHVAVPDATRFFLRRPFSIFDCTQNTIDLLIVELGPGTQALRALAAGDSVQFYGPLGRGFPEFPGKKILALGGGVGLAPLYYYGFRNPGALGVPSALGVPGSHYRLLYGARSKDDLFLDDVDLTAEGVALSTDDGSHGFHGNVVELAHAELERDPCDVIFSCGPTPMMAAAQRLAEQRDIPHYASLENRMGCALGACRACVVPTRLNGGTPYRTVCHDGPVFDGADLLWDELPVP